MADGAEPHEPTGVVPRHDQAAEIVCLSRAIDDHDAALELIELLDESDYYSHQHRFIHRAIKAICARGDTVDVTGVLGELRATNRDKDMGGAPYLAFLAGAPYGNVAQHARTVRNWARVRRAVSAFRELVAEGTVGELPDVDGWLDSCERRAYTATETTDASADTAATYADAGAALNAGWAEAAARHDRTWGTATGFSRLDEHTMGLQPGQIWYVGARPGQGKTAFAQQIAEYVAERGGGRDGVILLSMEMSRPELFNRAVARASLQSGRSIMKRSDRADWGAVAEGIRRVQTLPIAVDDQKGLTPVKVRAKVRRLSARLRQHFPESTLRLVVVDYIQLMGPDDVQRGSTRANDLGQISKALTAMAGEFKCTMLVLSQLTRPADKTKTPPPPTLFEFRDSGAIEADGNVVIGLHRPDQYRKPGEQHDHLCGVYVLKGRGVGEAAFELLYDGPTTRFDNIAARDDRLWQQESE